MTQQPKPFGATGSDGRRYGVDVVYDEFDGVVGRVAWFAGRHNVRRRADGTYVIVETGVVLTPDVDWLRSPSRRSVFGDLAD
jgi:hypothetical protein